jgi:alkylhydroperoxidase family enzyme
MARIPYGDEIQDRTNAALAEEIRKQRGGKLLNLYRMLLNSPPVARGWLNLLTAVRQHSTLPGRYREMAIMRVALINGAHYEYRAHLPFALNEGITQAQVDALPGWQDSTAFDDADRSVLAYTDSMTKDVQVPAEVFEAVARGLDTRQLTELTATVAAYNMVSRFLEALEIDPEEVPKP